ncbi:DUF2591 family protein [Serratia marcescens]
MTDYSNMSDFEINAAVATVKFGNWESNADIYPLITSKRIDYCNNPADAWPIIIENKISIISMYSGGDSWQVDAGEDEEFVLHQQSNPLRAAMIVFLMMKDAEKC